MTFLWIKQSVKLFLMLFKTPYRETRARSIIPFSQWVQASSCRVVALLGSLWGLG